RLVPGVGAALVQLQTLLGGRLAPRPKMFSREVAISPRKLPGDGDSTLVFEISDHRGYGILGRYLNTDVHMVRHQVPFNDPTFFLPSQLMKDGPECVTNMPKQGFTTLYGHEGSVLKVGMD